MTRVRFGADEARHDESHSPEEFFTLSRYRMLTMPRRETQHPVVHRFARERDEKGTR
jgi:hypothetical protein